MKKRYVIIIVLSILLCLANAEYVTAASGISEAEQTILDKLNAGVDVNGKIVHIPVSYINQIENELIRNKVDVTAKQAEVISIKIDEAVEILKTVSLKDLTEMRNTEAVFSILQLVDEAASEVDYKVSIDFANMSLNITSPDGNTIFVTKSGINQTGFDFAATVIVGVILLTLLICCIGFAYRMRLIITRRIRLQHYFMNKGKEG